MAGCFIRPPPGERADNRHEESKILINEPNHQQNRDRIKWVDRYFVPCEIVDDTDDQRQSERFEEQPEARLCSKKGEEAFHSRDLVEENARSTATSSLDM